MAGRPTLAGTYTVTVALTQPGRADTHSFTIDVACPTGHTPQSDRSCLPPRATVSGLAGSHRAVVDEPFETSFTYTPTDAELSVAPIAPSGLVLTPTHNEGRASLSGIPTHAGTYRAAVELTQPGRVDEYSIAIEATTYATAGTGNFELAVLVVAAPALTGFASTHNVTAGQPFSTGFTYRPAAAELTTTIHPPTMTITVVDRNGHVGLAATPRHADTYTITLRFDQPGRVDTRTIRVTAICPADQVTLPSRACAAPLQKLMQRHFVSIWPQPQGHLTNSCFKTELSGGSRVFTCRRIQEFRRYISKTSDEIVGRSDPHATYGTLLVLDSDELLEGCQSITSEDWQCDYRSDLVWHRRTVGTNVTNYIYPAYTQGVRRPAECANAIVELAVTRDPSALTSVIDTCLALLEEHE